MKTPLSSTHPRHIYHPDGRYAVAKTETEEPRLRAAGFVLDAPVPLVVKIEVPLEDQLKELKYALAQQNERFDANWQRLTKEHVDVTAQLEAANERNATLQKQFDDLAGAHAGQLQVNADLTKQLADVKAAVPEKKAKA